MNDIQTILYLCDGDLPGKQVVVRVQGGLRRANLAHDLAQRERSARLIIEQYKSGDKSWEVPRTQMPDGLNTE